MKNLFLLFALLIAGCATAPAPVEFPVSPRMATSYSNGETAIAWKAETGQIYTIYFTDAPHGTAPDWKPLPQANQLQGTGKQITVTDKVRPEIERRYMLLTGDQKP